MVSVNRRLRRINNFAGSVYTPGSPSAGAARRAGGEGRDAWVNHRDDTGTLRVGNQADLIVLDRDPFAAPAQQIHQTRVRATFVAGHEVWCG